MLQTTHMYRQVKSLNVLCTNSAGKEKHLETFDVQASDGWNAVAGGWIMLPLKKSCPEASKLWMIEMKAIQSEHAVALLQIQITHSSFSIGCV